RRHTRSKRDWSSDVCSSDLILDTKGYAVWSIHPQESVFAAIQQMAEKEVGALVVLDNEAIVGIISERDYARKVILKGRASHETRSEERRVGKEGRSRWAPED